MTRTPDRLLDEYLAAAARAGDRAALAELAARFEQRLLRHAWRLTGDAELARDVAQDAWIDIARGVHRLSDSAAFPSFAFSIVTRRAADAIRRRRRDRRVLAAAAAEPQSGAVSAATVESGAEAAKVAAAIAQLPSDQKAAIALFYLEDLSVAEIAAALGVPAGTVKTRLMAARARLHAALGPIKETIDEQT